MRSASVMVGALDTISPGIIPWCSCQLKFLGVIDFNGALRCSPGSLADEVRRGSTYKICCLLDQNRLAFA